MKYVKISKNQIRIGTRLEMEHTRSKKVARKIAMDHLTKESPIYYTYLVKMERQIKKDQAKGRY